MLDLSRAPYRLTLDLIAALRKDPAAWDRVRCTLTHDAGRGTVDENEGRRGQVACLLALCGPRDDADLLRRLLSEEIAARRAASDQGAGETLLALSTLLLECGAADDAVLFWAAKIANFDTWAGGYDLEFVFALGDPEATRRALIARGEAQTTTLQSLDLAELVAELPAWRATLSERVPRDLASLKLAAALEIAEVFEDREAIERLGLAAAGGPADLARLYRRLGQPAVALLHSRAVAAAATTSWDRAAAHVQAVRDAARAQADALVDVEALDALRQEIPSWPRVGLGRHATQVAYELAAVQPAPTGAAVFARAQLWRAELTGFPLAGLEAASRAAEKWGSPEEQAELGAALLRERAALRAR